MIKIKLVEKSKLEIEAERILNSGKDEAIFFAKHQFQNLLQKNLKMPVSMLHL